MSDHWMNFDAMRGREQDASCTKWLAFKRSGEAEQLTRDAYMIVSEQRASL